MELKRRVHAIEGMERLTDARIIERSMKDPQTFVLLFERHYDDVERFLTRRAGSTEGSELAAETFVRAFTIRRKYDVAYADARPWLYGIAANILRQHYKAEERRLWACAHVGSDLGTVAAPDVGDDAEVGELLRTLSSRDRDVLLLYAWADLEYEQIARALAIPVGTVRSSLHRIRNRLRRKLTFAFAGRTEVEHD